MRVEFTGNEQQSMGEDVNSPASPGTAAPSPRAADGGSVIPVPSHESRTAARVNSGNRTDLLWTRPLLGGLGRVLR